MIKAKKEYMKYFSEKAATAPTTKMAKQMLVKYLEIFLFFFNRFYW
jgi:hypothetical protein